MAIKFTAKDQPKATPAAAKTPVEKRDGAPAAAKDEAPAGSDLFNDAAKAPGKRKSK
jgi:hypothetical protein